MFKVNNKGTRNDANGVLAFGNHDGIKTTEFVLEWGNFKFESITITKNGFN